MMAVSELLKSWAMPPGQNPDRFKLLDFLSFILQAPLFGRIAKHQNHPDRPFLLIQNRRPAVFNHPLRAIFADQNSIVGQPDNPAGFKHLRHWIVTALTGMFVDNIENSLQRLAKSLFLPPAG